LHPDGLLRPRALSAPAPALRAAVELRALGAVDPEERGGGGRRDHEPPAGARGPREGRVGRREEDARVDRPPGRRPGGRGRVLQAGAARAAYGGGARRQGARRSEARRHRGVDPGRVGVRRPGGGQRERRARGAAGEPAGGGRGARVSAHAGRLPRARSEHAPAGSAGRRRGPGKRSMRSRPWLLAGTALLGACLLRNADPPRFFQPGSVALDATGEVGASPPAAGGVAIRLRAVRGAPFLRHRIVWRVSEVEYGLYEQRQWIDLPAHYAERALRTRLGETAGLRLTEDPRAAALRVDLLAFDEVFAPAHAADVALAVSLWDPER